MSSLIYIIIYLLCSVSGLALIKIGAGSAKLLLNHNTLIFNIPIKVLIGIALYGLSFLTWIIMLKSYDLSYIFPIVTGIGYILVMLVSFFFLKENINILKIIGAIFILIGIVIINIKR